MESRGFSVVWTPHPCWWATIAGARVMFVVSHAVAMFVDGVACLGRSSTPTPPLTQPSPSRSGWRGLVWRSVGASDKFGRACVRQLHHCWELVMCDSYMHEPCAAGCIGVDCMQRMEPCGVGTMVMILGHTHSWAMRRLRHLATCGILAQSVPNRRCRLSRG